MFAQAAAKRAGKEERPDMAKMFAQAAAKRAGKEERPDVARPQPEEKQDINAQKVKEEAVEIKKRQAHSGLVSDLKTHLPPRIEGGTFLAELQARKKPTGISPKPRISQMKAPTNSATDLSNYPRLSKDEFDNRVQERIQKYRDSSPETRKAAVDKFAARVTTSITKLIGRLYAYKRQRDILDAERARGGAVSELKTSVEGKEGAIFGVTFVKQSGAYNTLDWVEIQTMLYLLPVSFEKEPTPAMKESLVYIRDMLIPGMKKQLNNMVKTRRNPVYTNVAFPPMGPFSNIKDPEIQKSESHTVTKYERGVLT